MTSSEMIDWLNEHMVEVLRYPEIRALEAEGFVPIKSDVAVRLGPVCGRTGCQS